MLKLEPQTLNLTSRTRSFDFPRLGVHSIVRRMFSFVFVFLKDVGAHCHCASLVRTLFIRHARATSFSSARTESKTQQNIELMSFVLRPWQTRTHCCRHKCFPACAAQETSWATMCPKHNVSSFTRAFSLVCEYFCWMLGDPHIFFGISLPDSFHYTKKRKKSVRGKF